MDLLSPRPFWPIRDGLPATFPPLTENASCDVAIVGGGISGALVAWSLASAGLHVIVLDRREVAHGATAGNTGLVLYELDSMLHLLAKRIGRPCAERAYLRCHEAVTNLERLVKSAHLECDFVRRQSLYVAASPTHVPRLRREFEARRDAGLDVEWWTRRRIAAESSLPHTAAILSGNSAEVDPYRFTYGLLVAAQGAGAKIHDRTAVTRRTFRRHGVELLTSRGSRVRARQVVVATGYEAPASLTQHTSALHSTFALISEPMGKDEFSGWPANRCLIWDTANPYLYLRTTADHRAIIGGYDEEFRDPAARDRVLGAKTSALQRRIRQFFPRIPLEVATSWAGTFGISDDGLPFIGQRPETPHTWYALGFGGNGITFSIIAAEIIRAGIMGDKDPDTALFGFQRLA